MHAQTVNTVEGLSHLLADTYVLYVKTQNCHWNVKGAAFYAHHKMFEEQYEALADATDVIAERIRALQSIAPASLADFLRLASLDESIDISHSKTMIQMLLSDHETIAKNIFHLFKIAEKEEDEVTLDLLIQRKQEHDKIAWMLRSTLDKS